MSRALSEHPQSASREMGYGALTRIPCGTFEGEEGSEDLLHRRAVFMRSNM